MQNPFEFYSSLHFLDTHFSSKKIPHWTPSELKLKKLDNERSELVKLVKQERIISLKLSMINAILNPLQ